MITKTSFYFKVVTAILFGSWREEEVIDVDLVYVTYRYGFLCFLIRKDIKIMSKELYRKTEEIEKAEQLCTISQS
jgi:predicted nucleotidyltransferase